MKTLIKQSLIIITALTLTTVIACKKDKTKPNDTTQTDDQLRTELLTTENDTKAYGVYTGTLIGSSGYFEIFLKKVGSKVTVMFDGEKYELKSAEQINEATDVINYVFKNDKIKLTLNVKKDGTNPVLTVEKEGHTIIVIIHKVYTYYNIHNFVGLLTGGAPQYERTIMISGGATSGKFVAGPNGNGDGSIRMALKSLSLNSSGDLVIVTENNETMTFYKTGTNTYVGAGGGDSEFFLTKVN